MLNGTVASGIREPGDPVRQGRTRSKLSEGRGWRESGDLGSHPSPCDEGPRPASAHFPVWHGVAQVPSCSSSSFLRAALRIGGTVVSVVRIQAKQSEREREAKENPQPLQAAHTHTGAPQTHPRGASPLLVQSRKAVLMHLSSDQLGLLITGSREGGAASSLSAEPPGKLLRAVLLCAGAGLGLSS